MLSLFIINNSSPFLSDNQLIKLKDMTREEFLNVALLQATEEGIGIHLAKFADLCIEWTTNEVIDKACEWLSAELDKEEERHYIHVHGFDKERREIFLEDFRKAMKGGEE